MTGVRVHHEFGVLDPAMEVLGEHGWDHPVVVAVGDQRRLGDGRQINRGRSPPPLDCLQLGLERLDRDLLVAIRGALLQTFHERLGRWLAGRVAVEEQELLWVLAAQRGAGNVGVRGAGDLVHVLAACRAGTGQDQLADQCWVLDHQGLGDHPAKREREDVDRVVAERCDEPVGIVGHRLDRGGHGAGRGAEPAVVERDHVMPLRDRIDDARIPVVQVGREVDEEHDRDPARGAELPVGERDVAGGDGSRGCVLVGGDGHDVAEARAGYSAVRSAESAPRT